MRTDFKHPDCMDDAAVPLSVSKWSHVGYAHIFIFATCL